jgi:hypothetical protein
MLHQPATISSPRPLGRSLGGEAILHVCTMISNPVRYASRYRLYEGFVAQNLGRHVKFWTVEVAYGDRLFMISDPCNPHHLQLRTTCELWHKENALNLLFAHVVHQHPDAQYFAWVDADLTFVRPDWAFETLQQLQHFQVVQMFSYAQDVGPKYAPCAPKQHRGFMYAYCNDETFMNTAMRFGYSTNGHPGFAWAARRSALNAFGGLIDFAVTGGADRHMACGLLGTIERSGPYKEAKLTDLAPNFRNSLLLCRSEPRCYRATSDMWMVSCCTTGTAARRTANTETAGASTWTTNSTLDRSPPGRPGPLQPAAGTPKTPRRPPLLLPSPQRRLHR